MISCWLNRANQQALSLFLRPRYTISFGKRSEPQREIGSGQPLGRRNGAYSRTLFDDFDAENGEED
ncbi:Uncharacterised protein [Brevundimonas diminuta]|jgi:hypothetical protein|nr:hypothetical protein BDIM_06910 [Brevundimonas diminuta ATCC 11568]SPU43562.1 Uncharacterised protein [Brevundimonas diminuta]SUW16691.1 Uncharacterised protein [Brevundimonas diminuta]